MGFKLTKQQCEQILRDDYEEVFVSEIASLQTHLENELNHVSVRQIQGQIFMLRQIMGLEQKAREQLDH